MKKWYLFILVFAVVGCTVTMPSVPPSTGMEKYPTKKDQYFYDNFMLGRLKYYQHDEQVDLITVAFMDQRISPNEKLDDHEKKLLKNAIQLEKLYFTVGWPIYDPSTGRECDEKERAKAVATCNPLDYLPISDIKRWMGVTGAYVTFEDALWGIGKVRPTKEGPSNDPWGIVEIDFSPLKYGKPIRVLRSWNVDMNNPKDCHLVKLNIYKVDPSVCKLIKPDVRILYVE